MNILLIVRVYVQGILDAEFIKKGGLTKIPKWGFNKKKPRKLILTPILFTLENGLV